MVPSRFLPYYQITRVNIHRARKAGAGVNAEGNMIDGHPFLWDCWP